MPRNIRAIDAALAVWALLWLVGAVFVYSSVRQLEDLGGTMITAGDGLEETSGGLRRASAGLGDTGRALRSLDFLGSNIGVQVQRTAADVERIADRVDETAVQARRSGRDARDSARGLALVLGAAVLLVPTLPLAALYLLLRPLVAQQLARR